MTGHTLKDRHGLEEDSFKLRTYNTLGEAERLLPPGQAFTMLADLHIAGSDNLEVLRRLHADGRLGYLVVLGSSPGGKGAENMSQHVARHIRAVLD